MRSAGSRALLLPDDEELLAVLAEIEQQSRANSSDAAAAAATNATDGSLSLYDELVRYQNKHGIKDEYDAAVVLSTSIHTTSAAEVDAAILPPPPEQRNESLGSFASTVSSSGSRDRKPAARPVTAAPAVVPGQTYRRPISRNLFANHQKQASDPSVAAAAAPRKELSRSSFSAPGGPYSLEWQQDDDNASQERLSPLASLQEDQALVRQFQAQEEAWRGHSEKLLSRQMESLWRNDDAGDQQRLPNLQDDQKRAAAAQPPAGLDGMTVNEIEEQRRILQHIQQERASSSADPHQRHDDVSVSSANMVDQEQFLILHRIREQAERRELEQALRLSEHESSAQSTRQPDHRDGTAGAAPEYLQSQQAALMEYQPSNVSPLGAVMSPLSSYCSDRDRAPPPSPIDDRHDNAAVTNGARLRVSAFNNSHGVTHATVGTAAATRHQHDNSQQQQQQQQQHDLVRMGLLETQRAVQEGYAHIVECQGCGGRLQAPVHYSLVYCPACGVISPGLTVNRNRDRDRSSLSSSSLPSEEQQQQQQQQHQQ